MRKSGYLGTWEGGGAGGQGCWRIQVEERWGSSTSEMMTDSTPGVQGGHSRSQGGESHVLPVFVPYPTASHGKQPRAESKGSQLQVANLK